MSDKSMAGELTRMVEVLPDRVGDTIRDLIFAHERGDVAAVALEINALVEAIDDYGYERVMTSEP